MSFTAASLRSKLDSLTPTQESITSTSQWVLFYHRHAPVIAETWKDYVLANVSSAPANQSSSLTLLYLANDVVQQARAKRKQTFLDEFQKVMQEALNKVWENATGTTRDKIARLVEVWKSRSIFNPEMVLLGVSPGSSSSSVKGSGSGKLSVSSEDVITNFKKWYHHTLVNPGSEESVNELKKELSLTIEGLVELKNDVEKKTNKAGLQAQAKARADFAAKKKLELLNKVKEAEIERQKKLQEEEAVLPGYSKDSDSEEDSDGVKKPENSDSGSDDDDDAETDGTEKKVVKKLRFA